MDMDKWFVNSATKEIVIDGEKFVYRHETGGDQNKWLDHFMVPVYDESGNVIKYERSLAKQNECLLMNIIEVPFDEKIIGEVIGTKPMAWSQLSTEEKLTLLNKLNPALFTELIKKIRTEENQETDKKKS